MTKSIQLFLYFITFQIIIVSNIFARQDSTLIRYFGIETGYLTYSSRDDIFSTLLYSGSAPYYSINKLATTRKSIKNLKILYSVVKRRPATIDIPETFMIKGQDNGVTYIWDAEEELRSNNTHIVNICHNYYRKLSLCVFQKDAFYLGFCGNFDIILRNYFSNPELISYSLNPGFIYKVPVKKLFNLSFENSLSFLGMYIRKPYSGVDAQLTDDYDINFVMNYAYDHFKIDFFNNFFQFISQARIERQLTNKIHLNLGYQFSYMNLNKPRKLISVSNNFNIGIFYKIK